MQVTAIEGVVENGRIRLRESVSLAENTRVFVIVAEGAAAVLPKIASPHLRDPKQAADFRKQVVETPDNAKL